MERTYDEVKKVFNAMRSQMSVMSEYNDDEKALWDELATCSDEVFDQYKQDNGITDTPFTENELNMLIESILASINKMAEARTMLARYNADTTDIDKKLKEMNELNVKLCDMAKER